MKLFGRDPALFLGITASVLQLITLFFHLSVEWQGAANGLIVAIVGFVLAAKVSEEAGAAALIGIGKAAIAVALAFGAHMAPELQASVMAILTTLVSFYTRTQVTAPEPPKVALPGPLVSGTFQDNTGD